MDTDQEIFAEEVVGDGLVATEELTVGIAVYLELTARQVEVGTPEFADGGWGRLSTRLDGEGDQRREQDDCE